MPKRYLAFVISVAVLAVALSACGSSSGGSASAPAERDAKAVSSESADSTEEAGTAAGPDSELESIIKREIYCRWGGTPTEFDVAGGACKIDKINTSEAAIKGGGEAILDHEHNASVLVTPLKDNGGGATAKECQEAVAIAIG